MRKRGWIMKRFGFLTSGGDCQSLNATMRGVAKTLYEKYDEVQMYGFLEGYKGLIYGNYKKLTPSDFSGILTTISLPVLLLITTDTTSGIISPAFRTITVSPILISFSFILS